MNDRLEPLFFLPPPTDTPWSGESIDSSLWDIRRSDGPPLHIDLPLFWYEPPWCHVTVETANIVAAAVSRTGILVSALRSDLGWPNRPPSLHRTDKKHDQEPPESTAQRPSVAARIIPYRPERYGLNVRDFDEAKVIDVRLNMTRDASGRFAFSPAQIERWEATPVGQPLAGGSWVPAATFPPDVVSIEHLSSKLNQLRVLSPASAVLVSIGPYQMEQDITAILKAKPDGLILRLDEVSFDGLQLAALTRRARKLINSNGGEALPLWIVPGEITPDDAVKLVALGATAVAVDAWCDPLISEAAQRQQATAAQFGYSPSNQNDEGYLNQLTQFRLATRIERFQGLSQSLQRIPSDQQLGTFNDSWANFLSVKSLN